MPERGADNSEPGNMPFELWKQHLDQLSEAFQFPMEDIEFSRDFSYFFTHSQQAGSLFVKLHDALAQCDENADLSLQEQQERVKAVFWDSLKDAYRDSATNDPMPPQFYPSITAAIMAAYQPLLACLNRNQDSKDNPLTSDENLAAQFEVFLNQYFGENSDTTQLLGYLAELQTLLLDHQAGVIDVISSALDQFVQRFRDEGESARQWTAKRSYHLWVDFAEKAFHQYATSDRYQKNFAKFLNISLAIKKSADNLFEHYSKSANIPARREIDALYKQQLELKRKNRNLQRELDSLKSAVYSSMTQKTEVAGEMQNVDSPVDFRLDC